MGRLPDGRAVFVPYSLPGEIVRIRLIDEKRNFTRAELLEVLSPSQDRISPRCPHFSVCGGCHYQHMSYPHQLRAKRDILREQLERLGGMKDVLVEATVPSPLAWNYRNYIQFHLDPQGKPGFEGARTHQVVTIRECHLPEEAINIIWPQLQIEPLPGLERFSLRLGADEELLVVLESNTGEAPEFSVEDLSLSAVLAGPGGTLTLAGSDHIFIEVPPRSFFVSAGSFFQVNTRQASAMVEHLLANLPLSPQVTLLELYSGVGLFSVFLAPRVGKLLAIESSASACHDFEINLDEFDNIDLYEAAVEQVLPHLDIHPQIILVDPPRGGLGQKLIDNLVAFKAPFVAYVSCDPATLGRDARRLVEGGYQLEKITPFDLFPQTYHIESISFWKRNI